jgi:chorismate mutase
MAEISKLRQKVDAIDDQILTALCERVKICQAIGEKKKKLGKPIYDASRESEVYKRIRAKCSELGLDAGQIEALYHEIVNMCSAVQE